MIRRISSSGTWMPRTPFTFWIETVISRGVIGFPVLTSRCVDDTLPQSSSSTRWSALRIAISVVYSSTPFSYFAEASVRFPSALEVLRMLSRMNFADSNTTPFVVSRISEFSPPMTPASATGPSPSQMQRLFSFIS